MSLSLLTEAPILRLAATTRRASPALWRNALGMMLGCLACIVLMQIDQRSFNGINVWDKPAKFFLSLAVQLATVGFALHFVKQTRAIRFCVAAMIAMAWAEVLYIVFRAARAEASHFNDTPLGQLAYALMGFGALTLTATAFFIGLQVWRAKGKSLMAEATGLGLMLSMVLGTLAGFAIGAHHGHWVGGELSDAHGLGFFSWSTTWGDLRVAHFVGLHAAQGVPLAAPSGSRLAVWGVALLFVAATIFTFMQAVMGIPLFRA